MRNNSFQTQEFYLAAFLYTKGEEVLGVRPVNGTAVKMIIFKNSDRLLDLVDIYHFSDDEARAILVDPRDYSAAIRKLKDLIYN